MKKNKILQVRISEDELAYLNLKAQEKNFKNLSDYVRTSIITPININKKELLKMLYEINKIGTNLNQITYKINKNDLTSNLIQLELNKINENLEQIIDIFKNKQ